MPTTTLRWALTIEKKRKDNDINIVVLDKKHKKKINPIPYSIEKSYGKARLNIYRLFSLVFPIGKSISSYFAINNSTMSSFVNLMKNNISF